MKDLSDQSLMEIVSALGVRVSELTARLLNLEREVKDLWSEQQRLDNRTSGLGRIG